MTPFEKLPRIGSSHEYIPRPPQSNRLTTNPRRNILVKQEPILIAIRLSDGRRLQREFNPNDKVLDVIKYVKSQQLNVNDDFYLSSGDVPKRQFKDFNLTLLQANITTRSVLFYEISNIMFLFRFFLHAIHIEEINELFRLEKF